MNILDQLADYLSNQGLGTAGVDIFTGYLPQSPDSCLAIIDTGGPVQDIDIPLKDITFQVIVRDTNYTDGRTAMDSVRDALHQKRGFKVYDGEDYFYFIYANSAGGHIGRDENGRDEFSINFRARLR